MDPKDLGNCLRTCKNWRRLICDGALDDFWWNKASLDLHELLDEDGKLPLDGRRLCDVVAPRWLRRRDTYALLDGCKAEVIASAREDDGGGESRSCLSAAARVGQVAVSRLARATRAGG